MEKNNKEHTNWDKIAVYIAVLTGFLICINYIADMKERIAKLEVKIDKLEERK